MKSDSVHKQQCTCQGKLISTTDIVHICKKHTYPLSVLLHNAEFVAVHQKIFLTGIEASGLTDILPSMEQRGRGERG